MRFLPRKRTRTLRLMTNTRAMRQSAQQAIATNGVIQLAAPPPSGGVKPAQFVISQSSRFGVPFQSQPGGRDCTQVDVVRLYVSTTVMAPGPGIGAGHRWLPFVLDSELTR